MPNHIEPTPEFVEDRYSESVSTLRKLPAVKVQGYCNFWPGIIRTETELALMEKRPIRLKATPDAISRLEETLEWLRWLTVKERKTIWMRAAKVRWKTICWELGVSQSSASRILRTALSKIVTELNNDKNR